MQESVIFIIVSILIGGVIGGGTNRLAIAMLFRPYNVVRIGPWTLPFTPGLIPKRRHELARQLGRTVREYLVNGEALNRTIRNSEVQRHIVNWIKKEWRNAPHVSIHRFIEREEKQRQLERDMRVGDWFQIETKREIKKQVKNWAPKVNERLIHFLSSEQGTDTLRKVYGDWTRTQGWVGRLTGALLDESKMAEKSKEWLIQRLGTPQGIDMTRTLLGQAVDAVFDWRVRDVLDWAERNAKHSTSVWNETIEGLIERAVPYGLDRLVSRGEEWLDLMQLDTLVAEQIETFSLAKLEEMIVRVAKKELSLITWIGVLIGSFIGLCQGLIAGIVW